MESVSCVTITGIGYPIVNKASQMPQKSPHPSDEQRRQPSADDATERATVEAIRFMLRAAKQASAWPGITPRAAACFDRIAEALIQRLP